MVLLHVFDAFADSSAREGMIGQAALFIGGGAAPAFLALAGVATGLAMRRPGMRAEMLRRGVEIFSLALLFRVQEWALGGEGSSSRMLLRVDVLNCIGLSIIICALARSLLRRFQILLVAGLAWVAITPLFSTGSLLAAPLGWYLGGDPSYALFPLFPWTGYALIGTAFGTYASDDDVRIVTGGLWAGLAYACILTLRLTIPEPLHFQRTNLNFVFTIERCAAALALLAFTQWLPWKQMFLRLGTRSLFIYWVHVDLCFGLVFHHWKRTLSGPACIAATMILCALCDGLGYLLRASALPRFRKEEQCHSNALSPS